MDASDHSHPQQHGSRRCELATLAAAQTIGTSYCSIAHARVLRQWFEDEAIAALAEDHHSAGLDEVDDEIMDFAQLVASDPVAVTEDDISRLRAHGLDDRDILDVVLAVAARCFFATAIESLGAQADRKWLSDPTLRRFRGR